MSWEDKDWDALCTGLAGQGLSRCHKIWFYVQLACWSFVACHALHAASKWDENWGEVHEDNQWAVDLGCVKTLGFMIVDLLAVLVLWRGRNAYPDFEEWKESSSSDLDEKSEAARGLSKAARNLVGLGCFLCLSQAIHYQAYPSGTLSNVVGQRSTEIRLTSGELIHLQDLWPCSKRNAGDLQPRPGLCRVSGIGW